MNCEREEEEQVSVERNEEEDITRTTTHVAVDPACARRGAVEARDAVVGEERSEDGAAAG